MLMSGDRFRSSANPALDVAEEIGLEFGLRHFELSRALRTPPGEKCELDVTWNIRG